MQISTEKPFSGRFSIFHSMRLTRACLTSLGKMVNELSLVRNVTYTFTARSERDLITKLNEIKTGFGCKTVSIEAAEKKTPSTRIQIRRFMFSTSELD